MRFVQGKTLRLSTELWLDLNCAYRVFPSKMTAYGFKQGGAEGMAEGHPWGMCPHLIFECSNPCLQDG